MIKYSYGTVTSLIKDEEDGSQLVHVKSHLTDREYQNCEIITPKGYNYLPKIWDLVCIFEIHNSETIVFGVLEPFDFKLKEGEVLIHSGKKVSSGQIDRYDMISRVYLNEKHEIELNRGSTEFLSDENKNYNPNAKVKINEDNEVIIQKGRAENGELIPQQEIKLDKDWKVILQVLSNTGITKSKIVINADGSLDIEPQGAIRVQTNSNIDVNCVNATINATNEIILNAPSVQVI